MDWFLYDNGLRHETVKYDLINVLDWFRINSINTSPAKFQFMVLEVKNIAPFRLNINPLSANPTKWSNTLKQFVGNLFECV